MLGPASTIDSSGEARAIPLVGAARLRLALEAVLGTDFAVQLRAATEDSGWYVEAMPLEEVFRLWLADSLSAEDPLWVFHLVRAGERKYLADALGIPREQIVGRSPREFASMVLGACQLPLVPSQPQPGLTGLWAGLTKRAEGASTEHAAGFARRLAERTLRSMLFFYSAAVDARVVLGVLRDPGKLRVPRRLEVCRELVDPEAREVLLQAIKEDGWADLGFLILALRKVSARMELSGRKHPSGSKFVVLTEDEADRFQQLATALQPYTHDRPSVTEHARDQGFRLAVRAAADVVEQVSNRNALPASLFVVESGTSLVSPFFRGYTPSGEMRTLACEVSPHVGQCVLLLSSASVDHASCLWVEKPWPHGDFAEHV